MFRFPKLFYFTLYKIYKNLIFHLCYTYSRQEHVTLLLKILDLKILCSKHYFWYLSVISSNCETEFCRNSYQILLLPGFFKFLKISDLLVHLHHLYRHTYTDTSKKNNIKIGVTDMYNPQENNIHGFTSRTALCFYKYSQS